MTFFNQERFYCIDLTVCCFFPRDGATRSGLYCAISYMVERLKVEQEVDVFQSVKHTRINRPQLVPTLVGSHTAWLE